ncbi:MAG: class I SAM-dependent methyltransferase [Lachnospiraceae bacterium]|nr:class I SAM-dependent methyltransferase [Lachnospiraceae bacterium]
MKNEIKNVISFYNMNPNIEWNRLNGKYSNIEKTIVHRTIDKYINQTADILDLGCGPGRHAIELAKKGHKVFLVDIAQANLDFAFNEFKRNGLEDKLIGMECTSAHEFRINYRFDAVLAFGPFYHIIDESSITMTLENIRAMVTETGYVFVIFIQMISIFKDFLKRGWINEIRTIIDSKYPQTGIFYPANKKQIEQYMPDFRAYRYTDARQMLENAQYVVKEIITCESFAAFMRPYFENLEFSDEEYSKLLDELYDMAGQDFILNSTDHYLVVAKKI